MKNNKKGFTLVELLAVIVILAVVILIAVTAVIPRMNKARENSFKDEALVLIKGAEEAFVATSYDAPSGVGTKCYTVSTLTAANTGYVELKGGKNYEGKIVLNSDGKVTGVYLADTDNKYLIKNNEYNTNSTLSIASTYSALNATEKACQSGEL